MKTLWKIFKGFLMTIGALWLVAFVLTFAIAYASAPEYQPGPTTMEAKF